MRKKILLIVLIFLIILLIVPIILVLGRKKIVLNDTNCGTVTMNYSKKNDFEFSKIKTNEYKLISKELNVEVDLYMDKTTINYINSKKIRANYKGYQEYKFNKYKAYTFSQYGLQSDLQVFIYLNESTNNTILYMHLKPLDESKKIDLKEVFDNKKIVKMLKTIEYKEK